MCVMIAGLLVSPAVERLTAVCLNQLSLTRQRVLSSKQFIDQIVCFSKGSLDVFLILF